LLFSSSFALSVYVLSSSAAASDDEIGMRSPIDAGRRRKERSHFRSRVEEASDSHGNRAG